MLYANYVRNKMRHLYKTAEAEGVPCILKYSKGKYMKDYEIYGNSVQNGTPSPKNPVEIQSVGDLTKNLIPYPYTYTTTTTNGVTFTDNGDGSITIDGTATDNTVFYLVGKQDNYTLDKCGLKIGDSYTISKTLISGDSIANVYFTANYYDENGSMKAGASISNINTETATIQSDFKLWGIYLLVLKDKTVNNTTIKLQLEKGSSATEYEPYNKYDIPIMVAGKNLFDMETILPEQGWVKQDDGSYYVENASTPYKKVLWENAEGYTGQLKILFTFKYLKATWDNSAGVSICVLYTDGTVVSVQFSSAVEADTWHISNYNTITNSSKTVQKIEWEYGTSSNSTWVKDIIITKDITATEYEPYHEPITTHIYLDEPLRKVGDYSDYVDFKKQKVVRNVKEITFENTVFNEYTYGTEFDNTYHFNIRNMGCVYTSPMLCNIMKAGNISMNSTVNDTFFTSKYSNSANGGIYLQIEKSLIDDYSGESNAEKLKAFLINKNAKLLYCTTGYSEEPISLPTLQTFKGTTIMSVDTTVLPSNIKVTYVRT